uniref:Uncharacterized protein n=1 Tax=Arundo donax TaxID=35708 RepID=A0A0A9H575_ARUDO
MSSSVTRKGHQPMCIQINNASPNPSSKIRPNNF